MTDKPLNAAALRGAVDLSALARPAGRPGPVAAADAATRTGSEPATGAGPNDPNALVIRVDDTTIQPLLSASLRHAIVVVFYSSRLAQSLDFVDVMLGVAEQKQGRFQLAVVDADTSPGLLSAFQIQSVPAVFGLVQGQPVPLFVGVVGAAEAEQVIDQLLSFAVQNGVTGRVDPAVPSAAAAAAAAAAADGTQAPVEEELPPLHQAAYDAIDAGDLAGAVTAYEQALKQNPADAEAKLGLAQVRLLRRTEGVDLQAARAAAAVDPADVPAQALVADLDLSGGHIEDAFARLIDTVRVTEGADRDAARTHLLELFDLVGPGDPRVASARKSLMSALF